MTRAELVKFLEDNYEPDEQLVWQTMSFDDVENGIESVGLTADEGTWNEFVAKQDYYGGLATEFSEMTFNAFYDFVYDPEPENED